MAWVSLGQLRTMCAGLRQFKAQAFEGVSRVH
jgi:hypothetical protein